MIEVFTFEMYSYACMIQYCHTFVLRSYHLVQTPIRRKLQWYIHATQTPFYANRSIHHQPISPT